jgi:hypothetical protein
MTLVGAFATVAAPGARAAVEFSGILVTSQRTMFNLNDTSTGESQWRRTGEDFAGFTIGDYNARDDSLGLTKSGVTTRVHLKDAKVQSARLEITGTLTFAAGEKIQVTRATLVFDQENVFPLGDNLTCRITPQRRDDGTILYRALFERRLPDKTERLAIPAVVALPGLPFRIKVEDLEFAFSPRTL